VRSNGVDCMGTYSLLLVLSFSVLAGLHPARHCERSEAIHSDANEPWIASSLTLLAMTPWAVPNRSDLNQPAAVGNATQMIIGVAEGVLDHGQPFEIVADLGFHGHADAAMKLDRLLADKFSGLADLNLRRRNRGR